MKRSLYRCSSLPATLKVISNSKDLLVHTKIQKCSETIGTNRITFPSHECRKWKALKRFNRSFRPSSSFQNSCFHLENSTKSFQTDYHQRENRFYSTDEQVLSQLENETIITEQYIDKMMTGISSKYVVDRSVIQREIQQSAAKIGM